MIKNNFDFLRLFFASMVMFSHTIGLTKIPFLLELKPYLPIHMAVEGFFIISGYLIFMSFEKSSSLLSYTKKRASRILPAYIFLIISCAFFLFFVSELPFFEYFFSSTWIKYLISNLLFASFVQPYLPGVFNENVVNGSLWTIKIEVMFYFTVPLIVALLTKFNKYVVLLVVYILSLIYSSTMYSLYVETQQHIYFSFHEQLPRQLVYFVSGAFLYYQRDNFMQFKYIYLSLALIGLFLGSYLDTRIIYPISYAVFIIYFALHFSYIGNFGKFGDLSYGIYIYHYPIAAVFITFGLIENFHVIAYILLILTIVFTSYLSWNFIEKPFLRKKSHYKVSEVSEVSKG